jgi:hypothetical protein
MNGLTQLCTFHHYHQLCPLLQKLVEEKRLMPIHVGLNLQKENTYKIAKKINVIILPKLVSHGNSAT